MLFLPPYGNQNLSILVCAGWRTGVDKSSSVKENIFGVSEESEMLRVRKITCH